MNVIKRLALASVFVLGIGGLLSCNASSTEPSTTTVPDSTLYHQTYKAFAIYDVVQLSDNVTKFIVKACESIPAEFYLTKDMEAVVTIGAEKVTLQVVGFSEDSFYMYLIEDGTEAPWMFYRLTIDGHSNLFMLKKGDPYLYRLMPVEQNCQLD